MWYSLEIDKQTDSRGLVIGPRFTLWVRNPKKRHITDWFSVPTTHTNYLTKENNKLQKSPCTLIKTLQDLHESKPTNKWAQLYQPFIFPQLLRLIKKKNQVSLLDICYERTIEEILIKILPLSALLLAIPLVRECSRLYWKMLKYPFVL